MIIGQLVNGIVLDHITAGKGMEIYNVLGLGELNCTVALVKNADSVKMGKKDIIKIGQRIDLHVEVLGYLDPGSTVNIIENGQRVKRERLTLPEKVTGIIKCKNPRCITTTEQELAHVFVLTDPEKHVYRCLYCETQANK